MSRYFSLSKLGLLKWYLSPLSASLICSIMLALVYFFCLFTTPNSLLFGLSMLPLLLGVFYCTLDETTRRLHTAGLVTLGDRLVLRTIVGEVLVDYSDIESLSLTNRGYHQIKTFSSSKPIYISSDIEAIGPLISAISSRVKVSTVAPAFSFKVDSTYTFLVKLACVVPLGLVASGAVLDFGRIIGGTLKSKPVDLIFVYLFYFLSAAVITAVIYLLCYRKMVTAVSRQDKSVVFELGGRVGGIESSKVKKIFGFFNYFVFSTDKEGWFLMDSRLLDSKGRSEKGLAASVVNAAIESRPLLNS